MNGMSSVRAIGYTQLVLIVELILASIGLGEAVWAFKTTFDVTEKELAQPNVDLVFEGLDTNAVVELVSSLGSSDWGLTGR